jgi:hypothetical protein
VQVLEVVAYTPFLFGLYHNDPRPTKRLKTGADPRKSLSRLFRAEFFAPPAVNQSIALFAHSPSRPFVLSLLTRRDVHSISHIGADIPVMAFDVL